MAAPKLLLPGLVPRRPDGEPSRPTAPHRHRNGGGAGAADTEVAVEALIAGTAGSPGDAEVGEDEYIEIEPAELDVCECVGSGATAQVFRGFWCGQQVAIKELHLQRKKDARSELKQQVAFTRELAVMSKIQHENLVKFLGVILAERPLRLVTEFCEGDTLFQLLHEEEKIDVTWVQKLKMCRDVADAMCYLHSFKPQIIHRDLKSLNLLLAKAVRCSADVPFVKVSDFGMSRMKDADTGTEWDKMTKSAGTSHWMAPEVQTGNYDLKADVFSYGMVLFEIICREIPFEEAESDEAVNLVISGVRPDMEAVPPDRPPALEELMVACWSQQPKDRPGFPEVCARLSRIAL